VLIASGIINLAVSGAVVMYCIESRVKVVQEDLHEMRQHFESYKESIKSEMGELRQQVKTSHEKVVQCELHGRRQHLESFKNFEAEFNDLRQSVKAQRDKEDEEAQQDSGRDNCSQQAEHMLQPSSPIAAADQATSNDHPWVKACVAVVLGALTPWFLVLFLERVPNIGDDVKVGLFLAFMFSPLAMPALAVMLRFNFFISSHFALVTRIAVALATWFDVLVSFVFGELAMKVFISLKSSKGPFKEPRFWAMVVMLIGIGALTAIELMFV